MNDDLSNNEERSNQGKYGSEKMRLISSYEKQEIERRQAATQRHMVTWNTFTNINEDVEKITLPMIIGDLHDTGNINEVIS